MAGKLTEHHGEEVCGLLSTIRSISEFEKSVECPLLTVRPRR